MMSLHVSPKKSMFDEEINISASGLDPNKAYTFYLNLTHRNGVHEAYATFKPDIYGKIHLSSMIPISGTYSEPLKMGLFISMIPAKTNKPASAVVLDPVDQVKIYHLELREENGEILDKVEFERYVMHPDVERTEIETPELTGTLFRPKGPGPFPAIIDMYGSRGGIKEDRAALLASHGFVTLCLPFFNYKNLPKQIVDVNMEYFQYAIDYICALPYTTDHCGMIGNSFGSQIAMLCAIRYPKLCCVVNVNGSPALEAFTAFRENGKTLPYFMPEGGHGMELEKIVGEIDGKLIIAHDEFYRKVPQDHWRLGPIENIPKTTAIYYIACLDDLGVNSVEAAEYNYRKLKNSGHNKVVVDVRPGGHLMDFPYMPLKTIVYTKHFGIYQAFGGEPVSHCKSQEEFWPKIINFFTENIGKPAKMRTLQEIFDEKCKM